MPVTAVKLENNAGALIENANQKELFQVNISRFETPRLIQFFSDCTRRYGGGARTYRGPRVPGLATKLDSLLPSRGGSVRR